MTVPEALFYVGIDWATETHAICVLTAAGKIKTQFMIEHTAIGFADLIRRLGRLTGNPADVPIGIERPDGRLVDALLEAGFPVVPVSPNAIKTWRDGEVLSGAKSDAGDATVIAEYLRLRAHHLRVATPYSSETRALRTVVRARDDVVDMRVAATNQLSALLDANWPGATAIFADVESAISLAFLTRYPTYLSTEHLRRETFAGLLCQARLLRSPERRGAARPVAGGPGRQHR
jgi:transposase